MPFADIDGIRTHYQLLGDGPPLLLLERARKSSDFWSDPEAGPWASVIASDPDFAASYAHQDLEEYLSVVNQSRDNLFRDPMPSGASCEELTAISAPTFIMAGNDAWHATSAAHILRELIPNAKLSSLLPR